MPRLNTLALIALIPVLAGCASTVVSDAGAPHAGVTPRTIDPFTGAPRARSAGTGHSQTRGATPAMADGVSSQPLYNLFGEAPNIGVASLQQDSPFDAAENVRRITDSDEGADFDPCVSPDGQWVFFASTRHRPTSDIYVKRTDGTAVTQLTTDPAQDVMPSVSPDGRRIAFASNRNGSFDIYVMNAPGAPGSPQPVQITSDPGQELRPTWAPDSRTIAFCRRSERSDRWEIWTTDTTRPGAAKFLTYGLFPAWQPGGEKIAFQRARERGSRCFSIWTIDYTNGEATNPTEVISSPIAAAINPTWSPDGEYIAFSTLLRPDQSAAPRTGTASPGAPAQADLWIVKADGTARANLTSGWFSNLSPAWGADGRIYFVSTRSGSDNLWSISTAPAILAATSAPEAQTQHAQADPHQQEQPASLTQEASGDEADPH